MNCFTVFLCVLAAVTSGSATDYCSSTLCGDGVKHIACDHSGEFDSTCPDDAKMVTISSDLQQLLVDNHNEKRNFIAGGGDANHSPACRMATMQWDDELAEIAAFNVKQCKMEHDKCRSTDAYKYAGQNLARMGLVGPADDATQLNQSVQMWFDEVKKSKQSYIDSYPIGDSGTSVGHFTCMMRDSNVRVGCAASTYTPADASYSNYLVACNYATTNIIDQPIYEKCDDAATSCSTGTNPDYPNLCSDSEVYSDI